MILLVLLLVLVLVLVLLLLLLLLLLRGRDLGLLSFRQSSGHVWARHGARLTDETALQSTLHSTLHLHVHVLEVVEGALHLTRLEWERLRFEHRARYLCWVERGERGRYGTKLDAGDVGGSLWWWEGGEGRGVIDGGTGDLDGERGVSRVEAVAT